MRTQTAPNLLTLYLYRRMYPKHHSLKLSLNKKFKRTNPKEDFGLYSWAQMALNGMLLDSEQLANRCLWLLMVGAAVAETLRQTAGLMWFKKNIEYKQLKTEVTVG